MTQPRFPNFEDDAVEDRDSQSRNDDDKNIAREHDVADAQPAGKAGDAGGCDAQSDADSRSEIPINLPRPAVGRLSLYYRELHRLLDSDATSVNSQELGRMVDVSPAVVRRDLSALGTIGRRGVGYDIETLVDRIGRVLGAGIQWKVVLVGVGSLGDALLRYRGFERLGFGLSAAFDNDPKRIGTAIGGIEIVDVALLDSVLAAEPAELAILAVPAEHAAQIAARLVACKVSGILNFAPTTLRLPRGIAVVNVDLASELQRLAFSVQTHK